MNNKSKYFNPFYDVTDEKLNTDATTGTKYIHARTLRTTFLRKLWLTFRTFTGSALLQPEHVGLLDYPLLMIPRILGKVLGNAQYANGKALILQGAFLLARTAAATALTLALSPIVAAVHLVSRIASYGYRKALNVTLKGNKNLNAFVRKIHLLENVQIDVSGSTNALNLHFKTMDKALRTPNVNTSINLDVSKNAEGTPNNQEDYAAFKAILKMNVSPSSNIYCQWRQVKNRLAPLENPHANNQDQPLTVFKK